MAEEQINDAMASVTMTDMIRSVLSIQTADIKMVNLSERTMNDVSDEELTQEIDFTYANEQIDRFRQHSIQKLNELISDELV